ncbi:DGQHR domain-containing protein [Qipengyuania aquimaris]|uniref:DGQHR domain-containing protein n=1 Tax=Qipengyuania aquimaris TaxID=255984 RepID=UPI001CD301CE|nr:DGQHR domain-containing protein [Qipengyuania aquimaris]MCA0904411.1 DGQHR domain-containing protein [Qipengyuania aquimaris]
MASENTTAIRLPVSRVSQPIGDFYVGKMDARKLIDISYTEIRAFLEGTQDKIAGIQRERSEKRITEIKRYVNLEYATFPTSVIISVDADCADVNPYADDDDSILQLTLSPFGKPGEPDHIPLEKIAFIIDGQHRVAGLEGLEPDRNFDVNVSVFVGASEADKAEIFARVNQAQTKVNQSLVVDLASFYEERGPLKFAHEVVLALNKAPKGPLHDKVKRLGKAQPGKGKIQTLAQATVVKPIVAYITRDPEGERNKRYKGIFSSKREPDAWRTFIFQPFYDDENARGVFEILTNYFAAVKAKWPDSWDDAPAGNILNRTTGYAALMRFLRPVYLSACDRGEVLSREACDEIFDRIEISDEELTRDNFLPGSSGISALYRRLMKEAGLS